MHSEAQEREETPLHLRLPVLSSLVSDTSTMKNHNDYSQQDSIILLWCYKSNAQLLYFINAWILIVTDGLSGIWA